MLDDHHNEAGKDIFREIVLNKLNARYSFVKEESGSYSLELTDDLQAPYLDSLLLIYFLSKDDNLESPPRILVDSVSRRVDQAKLNTQIENVLKDKNPVNYSLNDLRKLVSDSKDCERKLEYLVEVMLTTDSDFSWIPPRNVTQLEQVINEADQRRSTISKNLGISKIEELKDL